MNDEIIYYVFLWGLIISRVQCINSWLYFLMLIATNIRRLPSHDNNIGHNKSRIVFKFIHRYMVRFHIGKEKEIADTKSRANRRRLIWIWAMFAINITVRIPLQRLFILRLYLKLDFRVIFILSKNLRSLWFVYVLVTLIV